MKIYNGTNSVMNLPLNNGSRLIIRPRSLSDPFLASTEVLQLVVSAFSRNDIAIIPSGASELNLSSTVSALPAYIAYTEEEAITRFVKPEETKSSTETEEVKTDEVIEGGKSKKDK